MTAPIPFKAIPLSPRGAAAKPVVIAAGAAAIAVVNPGVRSVVGAATAAVATGAENQKFAKCTYNKLTYFTIKSKKKKIMTTYFPKEQLLHRRI